MPSSIIGAVLMLGIVTAMAAIATPAFLHAADTARLVAEAQARANEELLACLDGPGTCTRLQPEEELVCTTDHDPLSGDETTVCRVQPRAPEAPPVVGAPPSPSPAPGGKP